MKAETAAALSLLSAQAVRTRAQPMLALGLDDRLPNFRVDLSIAGRHRRARAGGDAAGLSVARRAVSFALAAFRRQRRGPLCRARRQGDLARRRRPRPGRIRSRHRQRVSRCRRRRAWRYSDGPSGQRIGRSEGLALASLDMFARGAFSADPDDPLRVDASVLAQLTADATGARLSGDGRQSAGRARRPRRSAAPSRRAGQRKAGRVCAPRQRAPGRAVRSHRRGRTAAAALPRRRSCRRCCWNSARSGRRALSSAAYRWAIAGGIRRSSRPTPPTA